MTADAANGPGEKLIYRALKEFFGGQPPEWADDFAALVDRLSPAPREAAHEPEREGVRLLDNLLGLWRLRPHEFKREKALAFVSAALARARALGAEEQKRRDVEKCEALASQRDDSAAEAKRTGCDLVAGLQRCEADAMRECAAEIVKEQP
ncbi:MAG TPA: hypothetical protein VJP77_05810 [Planctomycetota bacterium]|nr:hypothetical protein [Planctomycetota bacterium]